VKYTFLIIYVIVNCIFYKVAGICEGTLCGALSVPQDPKRKTSNMILSWRCCFQLIFLPTM